MTKQQARLLFWIFGMTAIVCHVGWVWVGFAFEHQYLTLVKTLCIIEVISAIFWWIIVAMYRNWLVK